MAQAECNDCGAFPTLLEDFVLRRHLDPKATGPRRERLCPSGHTRNWTPLDPATQAAAEAYWAAKGSRGPQ